MSLFLVSCSNKKSDANNENNDNEEQSEIIDDETKDEDDDTKIKNGRTFDDPTEEWIPLEGSWII